MLAEPHMAPSEAAPDLTGIRPARRSDLPALTQLWRELMRYHAPLDPRFALAEDADRRFRQYAESALDRSDYQIFVASPGATPVGFVIACVLPNSPVYRAQWIGYINDLGVSERARRSGWGQRLVHAARMWLTEQGADSVEVYVAAANPGAVAFWQATGAAPYLLRMALPTGAAPEEY